MVTKDGVKFEGGFVGDPPWRYGLPLIGDALGTPEDRWNRLHGIPDALGKSNNEVVDDIVIENTTPIDGEDIQAIGDGNPPAKVAKICSCNKLLNEVCMACAKPIADPPLVVIPDDNGVFKKSDNRDGMREVCLDSCNELQRAACIGTQHKSPTGQMRNRVVRIMNNCPEDGPPKEKPKPVVNAMTDCIHAKTCRRECVAVDNKYPAWLQPADSHVSAGWVPCHDYEQGEPVAEQKTLLDKEITHHCKHVGMVGNTMQTCINDGQLCVSYSKCCNYEKGNKI